MKKAITIILGLIGVVILASIGGVVYISVALPSVEPARDMSIATTPQLVERGSYLANHVAVCTDCHSTRDWSKFSGPIIPGTEGKGGERFDEDLGFPGVFYSKNITPANLGTWTDGELYRLITTGVTKDGEPIFPLMPFISYGKMDPDDVNAIIAYIRTLHPIASDIPPSSANFPMNIIMRTIPKDIETPGKRPPASNRLEYGKYLTSIAACADCHTPQEKGQPLEGMYMAGGFSFVMPNGTVVRSANITPHKERGIGRWTEEQFVQRFTAYRQPAANHTIGHGEFNTVMPWTRYAGMTDDDLGAIYTYLMSVPPNEHEVEKFTVLATAHSAQ